MSAGRLPISILEGSPLHVGLRVARALAIVAAVFALPYILEPFRIGQVAGACVFAIAVVGLNLLSGFGGQISLGHAAFFGLGAYTTGILVTEYDVSPPVSFVVGVVLCFVVGAAVAFPAMRLKGIYVALVTLAVGLIFPTLVTRFDNLTGGPSGLFGIKYPPPDIPYFAGFNGTVFFHYWLAIAGLALSCLVVRNIVRSRFGRGVIALRDNETAAIVMGVNRTKARVLTFGTSAGIAGLGGGLFAVISGILTPSTFSLLLTLYFLAGLVIGGASSLWGPILGGFIIYFVPSWAASLSSVSTGSSLAGVFFGLIIIAMTFTLRSGVAGLGRKAFGKVVVIVPRAPQHEPQSSAVARGRDGHGGVEAVVTVVTPPSTATDRAEVARTDASNRR